MKASTILFLVLAKVAAAHPVPPASSAELVVSAEAISQDEGVCALQRTRQAKRGGAEVSNGAQMEPSTDALARGSAIANPSGLPEASTSVIANISYQPPYIPQEDCWKVGKGGVLKMKSCQPASNKLMFQLYNYSLILHKGMCLQASKKEAVFTTCNATDTSQWFQFAQVGIGGPICNCRCTSPTNCDLPCNDPSVMCLANNTKGKIVLRNFTYPPSWYPKFVYNY